MGRRAKPVEMMVLTGKKNLTKSEIQGRRKAEEELTPAGKPLADVKPPKWLDRASKREWRRMVKLIGDLGIVTEADANTLAAYCDATVRYAEASKIVQEEGPVVASDSGRPMQNPAVLAAAKYWQIMNKASRALGLDPSARASLAKVKAEEGSRDEFEELFGHGNGGDGRRNRVRR